MNDINEYISYNDLPFGDAEKFNLIEALITRRTVRKYKNDHIPNKVVEEILSLCTNVPSNCNKQGWHFMRPLHIC